MSYPVHGFACQPCARDEILTTALQVPELDKDTRERRITFAAAYFEEAVGKAAL